MVRQYMKLNSCHQIRRALVKTIINKDDYDIGCNIWVKSKQTQCKYLSNRGSNENVAFIFLTGISSS